MEGSTVLPHVLSVLQPLWNLSLLQLCLLSALSVFLAILLAVAFRPSQYPTLKGPRGVPFLGNLPEFISKGPLECFSEWKSEYGNIFKCYLGLKEFLVVADPELLKEMTVKRFKAFKNRPMPADFAGNLLLGLVWGRGQHWSTSRNAMLPMFHNSEYLQNYIPTMQSTIKQFSAELKGLPKGKTVDIHDRLQVLTLDVFSRASFGDTMSTTEFSASTVAMVVKDIFKAASIPMLTTVVSFFLPFAASRLFLRLRAMIPFTEERVRWNRAAYQQHIGEELLKARMREEEEEEEEVKEGIRTKERNDVLSHLARTQRKAVKGQPVLSREAMSYLLGELVVVGTDTTANVLALTIFLLCTHPKVEAKLVAEIKKLVKEHPPTTLENLEKYTYTNMVVKEVLRLYPTGGQIFREAVEDSSLGGVRVPKGAVIMSMPMVLHRDPKNFHHPDSFIPERFDPSSKEAEGNNMSAYVPFGLGPRTCLGYKFALQEAAVVIIQLYQHHSFELKGECEGLLGDEAIAALPVDTTLVTKPTHGVPVVVSDKEL